MLHPDGKNHCTFRGVASTGAVIPSRLVKQAQGSQCLQPKKISDIRLPSIHPFPPDPLNLQPPTSPSSSPNQSSLGASTSASLPFGSTRFDCIVSCSRPATTWRKRFDVFVYIETLLVAPFRLYFPLFDAATTTTHLIIRRFAIRAPRLLVVSCHHREAL